MDKYIRTPITEDITSDLQQSEEPGLCFRNVSKKRRLSVMKISVQKHYGKSKWRIFR